MHLVHPLQHSLAPPGPLLCSTVQSWPGKWLVPCHRLMFVLSPSWDFRGRKPIINASRPCSMGVLLCWAAQGLKALTGPQQALMCVRACVCVFVYSSVNLYLGKHVASQLCPLCHSLLTPPLDPWLRVWVEMEKYGKWDRMGSKPKDAQGKRFSI